MAPATLSNVPGLLRLGVGLGAMVLDLAVFQVLARSSSSEHEGTKNHQRLRRRLEQRDFDPQGCRLSRCRPWTEVFGSQSVYEARVVIDCTTCITMDHTDFRLEDGLDIRGRLVVPDGTSLRMDTTSIVVQGDLTVTATQPVDGKPSVVVTMIGDDDEQTFEVPNDAAQCRMDINSCKIGQKGIVVAGGSINLRGLADNVPTWLPLYDVSGGSYRNPDTLVVSDTVLGSWAPGAELLITSHTTAWDNHATRSIKSVRRAKQAGFVELKLNKPIKRPTIAKEDAEFAVEVALLSRNIVLDTEDGADVGGHLEIRRTSANKQLVDGVDVRNFGQAGVKGRYPIHTHFCGKLDGSIISRNTVRHSKQRCIVVHGTDKLLVQENVAYDTKGHCFMTEDGIETENRFIRNLGAKTSSATTLIEGENDDEPATFWIVNPTNYYIGNVAAGSQDSGFWFDARLRGNRAYFFSHLDPMHDPLLAFDSNVAHSNMGKLGAIRTYTPGYLPHTEAVFSNLRVYRNQNVGVVLHKCHNIVVRDSMFADNGRSLDIDRAEAITVENVVIIGESSSYRNLMGRETGVRAPCFNQRMIGLDLHTWKLHKQYGGATLKNVHFSGFKNTECPKPSAIWMDGFNVRQGQFELYSSFKDVTLDDGAQTINFCDAEAKGINSVYLVDLDGSFSDDAGSPSSPSVLIGSDLELMKFVDKSSCQRVSKGCYNYCADVCFRSYRYELSNVGTADYKLQVCRADKRSNCASFSGSQRGPRDPRTFVAHMPTGFDYIAKFVDEAGEVRKPPVLDEQYEINLCGKKEPFSVELA